MRKVLGVGINDLPGWSNWRALGKENIKYRLYVLWKSMLARCYDHKYQETHPTYKGCLVCEPWLKFSVFVREIQTVGGYEIWRDNPGQLISLDKDLNSCGSKIYSAKTCTFLSANDNIAEMWRRNRTNILKQAIPRLVQFSLARTKQIKCLYSSGEFVVFNSTKELEKAGFNRRHVYSCCRGDRKQHKGCKFSFID